MCVCLRFTNLSPSLDLSVSQGSQQGLLQQEQPEGRRHVLLLPSGEEVEVDDDDLIEQAAVYLSGPRTRFLRYGYYYDLSKNVYRRARRLPVIRYNSYWHTPGGGLVWGG